MTTFELFQNKILNQRLMIVIFELLLKEIFPYNYFEEIYARLYISFYNNKGNNVNGNNSNNSTNNNNSSYHHKSLDGGSDWPPHLSKFIARI